MAVDDEVNEDKEKDVWKKDSRKILELKSWLLVEEVDNHTSYLSRAPRAVAV